MGGKTALVVFAHPEERSFCAAMKNTTVSTLKSMGWTVEVSDLYAMNFNPVTGPNNFTELKPGTEEYFKQQQQEPWASKHGKFAKDIQEEMAKLKRCDVLFFHFPMNWFAVPAILKGWIDRVFAMGTIYGKGAENAMSGKRAIPVFTTGAPAAFLEKDMLNILFPLNKGVFAFAGLTPLMYQCAWAAAHVSDNDRRNYLAQWEQRLRSDLTKEEPLQL